MAFAGEALRAVELIGGHSPPNPQHKALRRVDKQGPDWVCRPFSIPW